MDGSMWIGWLRVIIVGRAKVAEAAVEQNLDWITRLSGPDWALSGCDLRSDPNSECNSSPDGALPPCPSTPGQLTIPSGVTSIPSWQYADC